MATAPTEKADMFGVKTPDFYKPITADTAIITWGDYSGTANTEILTGASNLAMSYQRGVNRRYGLGRGATGGSVAITYPTRPMGQLSMSHLFIETSVATELFGRPGWNACAPPATLRVTLGNNRNLIGEGCSGVQPVTFVIGGALVTSWNLQMEADGLTVMQSITIEFMHLEKA